MCFGLMWIFIYFIVGMWMFDFRNGWVGYVRYICICGCKYVVIGKLFLVWNVGN